jgi:hypothetical protein
MENEAAHLRTDIERYRKLLNCVGDKVAIETLELMIAEKEKRLLAIQGGRPKRG